MTDMNTLLVKAISETSYLNNGEVFLLRDLFKGYEWNRISRSNRILLGTLFLNKINSESLEVKASIKISSGQRKYQIIRRKNHA
ncbi:single-stranded DNA-binding protein [Acetobacterium woodii]|uniref:single-stranded DNA-binding protein n=1 Tax=Acetobacterium woodii TaxID=33952 RepID=UPI0005A036C4|nr:single-stranded DNA-binding protein [Acetobacterium woodii]